MKYPSETIENAINEISKLPGIGKKTALRLSLHLLKKKKEYSKNLAESIINLKEKTKYCIECHIMSDEDLCKNCKNESGYTRTNQLCIVEDTPDVIAIQNTNQYNGLFHVLSGIISPINGIGPDKLNINSLIKRIEGTNDIDLKLMLGKQITNKIYVNTQLNFDNEGSLLENTQYEATYRLSKRSSIVGGVDADKFAVQGHQGAAGVAWID